MSKLLKHHWADETVNWLEADIQAAIVRELRQKNILFEVGLDGVKLTKGQAGKAKAAGMDRGKCDLKIYLRGGRTVQIELKRKGGRVSTAQADWHAVLKLLGHEVHVVVARSPKDGIDQVLELIGVN